MANLSNDPANRDIMREAQGRAQQDSSSPGGSGLRYSQHNSPTHSHSSALLAVHGTSNPENRPVVGTDSGGSLTHLTVLTKANKLGLVDPSSCSVCQDSKAPVTPEKLCDVQLGC